MIINEIELIAIIRLRAKLCRVYNLIDGVSRDARGPPPQQHGVFVYQSLQSSLANIRVSLPV